MNVKSNLVIPEGIYQRLHKHLFPGDGKESAAILLCNRNEGSRFKLLVKEIIPVPDDECESRKINFISWPGLYLEKAIDAAETASMSVILVHSHPGGLFEFSLYDDESDAITIPALYQAVKAVHGSAIMIHDGRMRARFYSEDLNVKDVDLISVPGDDICLWRPDDKVPQKEVIAFTSGMTECFSHLTAAVIGVSGTGSIVAEQVTRLGFGKILLVDDDHIEEKNLNRILNATREDASHNVSKVEMFAAAVSRIRGKNVATAIHSSIFAREAVLAVADADVIFCCVDSFQGRMVADLISSAFLIPLLDVGVKIPTHIEPEDGLKITDVSGRIDYVKPGGATLFDREVYTPALLHGEMIEKMQPELYKQQLAQGYITGIQEEAPSVITLNMRAASACVSEFIARCFPFREDPNSFFSRTLFSLSGVEDNFYKEDTFSKRKNLLLAEGCSEPLLGMPEMRAAK
ncbi:ThiF family adenylyltransferase [Cronobacter dublinensis]|uniref:ThiF family adenylyltransferase n=1 Tax=Cronobacter dublinensis TaxID=413497 RepID=UPI000CFAA57F|nr:ThiF family adenylyltransferase [Cronobacter dublinensis]